MLSLDLEIPQYASHLVKEGLPTSFHFKSRSFNCDAVKYCGLSIDYQVVVADVYVNRVGPRQLSNPLELHDFISRPAGATMQPHPRRLAMVLS